MMRVLHAEHEFSDRFISYMLARNIRLEAGLIDQLFNSTEKRLARAFCCSLYTDGDQTQKVLPRISQETLAQTIGTTRSRVNLFMNKFKKLGFIKYNGGLQINNSLLSVVLTTNNQLRCFELFGSWRCVPRSHACSSRQPRMRTSCTCGT